MVNDKQTQFDLTISNKEPVSAIQISDITIKVKDTLNYKVSEYQISDEDGDSITMDAKAVNALN